jgi:aryl-alcohol dehydrogenase-like predicted oxidoreductase
LPDRVAPKLVERHGIGFMPWAPVAMGRLSGGSIAAIAKAHHATPSQIALARLLKRNPVMLPIPGTFKIDLWVVAKEAKGQLGELTQAVQGAAA